MTVEELGELIASTKFEIYEVPASWTRYADDAPLTADQVEAILNAPREAWDIAREIIRAHPALGTGWAALQAVYERKRSGDD